MTNTASVTSILEQNLAKATNAAATEVMRVKESHSRIERDLVGMSRNLINATKHMDEVDRRVDMLRTVIGDQKNAISLEKMRQALDHPDIGITQEFQVAATECFNEFGRALYALTVEYEISGWRSRSSAVVAAGAAIAIYILDKQFPNLLLPKVICGGLIIAGVVGTQADRGPSAKALFNLFSAPIRIPFNRFARRKFIAVNENDLRAEFFAIWSLPAETRQQLWPESVIARTVQELTAPSSPSLSLSREEIEIGLLKNMTEAFKAGRSQVLQQASERLPLRSLRGLISKHILPRPSVVTS